MHSSIHGHDWTKWKHDVCAIFIASIPLSLGMVISTISTTALMPLAMMYTAFVACVAITYYEFYMNLDEHDLERLDYQAHSMRIGVIIVCYCFPMLFGGLARLKYCVIILLVLGVGGYLYANKIPETWGTDPRIGNSNHLMHICIIVAHVCNYLYAVGSAKPVF